MSKTTTIKQEDSVKYLMDALTASDTKEDFILTLWMYWAQSVTITDREFQQVISNRPVNKWFLNFIKNEENEFKILARSYSELAGQGKEIDLLYAKCMSKVMSRFPQALLEVAKKRTEKPHNIKAIGIKIEFPIINLN